MSILDTIKAVEKYDSENPVVESMQTPLSKLEQAEAHQNALPSPEEARAELGGEAFSGALGAQDGVFRGGDDHINAAIATGKRLLTSESDFGKTARKFLGMTEDDRTEEEVKNEYNTALEESVAPPAPTDAKGIYQEELGRFRNQKVESAKRDPLSFSTGQLGGEVGSSIAALGSAGLKAVEGNSLIQNMMLSSAVGASEAGVRAVFEDKDVIDAMGFGAAAGAVGHPLFRGGTIAAKAAGNVGKSIGKKIQQNFLGAGNIHAQDKAVDMMIDKVAIALDVDPSQLPIAHMKEAIRNLDPTKATPMDVQNIFLDMAGGIRAMDLPNARGQTVKLRQRAEDAPEVYKAEVDALTDKTNIPSRPQMDRKDTKDRKEAGKKREAAVQANVEGIHVFKGDIGKQLQHFLMGPQSTSADRDIGESLGKLLYGKDKAFGNVLTPEDLLRFRKEIDLVLQGTRGTGNTTLTPARKKQADAATRKLFKMRNAVNKHIHADPEIAKWDNRFAEKYQMKEGYDLAEGIMTGSSKLVNIVDFLDGSNSQMIKGYHANVKRVATEAIRADPDIVSRALGKGGSMYKKLELTMDKKVLDSIISSAAKAAKYQNTADYFELAGKVAAGVGTAPADFKAAADAAVIGTVNANSKSKVDAMARMAQRGIDLITPHTSKATQGEAMKMLTSQGGDANRVLDKLLDQMPINKAGQNPAAALSPLITGTAGGIEGAEQAPPNGG